MHRLPNLLYKEDQIPSKGGVGLCTDIRGNSADIASHKNATGCSCNILRMGRYFVEWHKTHQHIAHQGAGHVGSSSSEVGTHSPVYAHHLGAVKYTVQGGNVAESNQPLGVCSPF